MNKLLITGLMLLGLCGGMTSCVTGDSGAGIAVIETLEEQEYAKWRLYIQLGTKIGANRLLEEGSVTEEELVQTANVLTSLTETVVLIGAENLLTDALDDAGLTNEEVKLLILIFEQELRDRGAFSWVDPNTGLTALSPRTRDIIIVISNALLSASVVTEDELLEGDNLEEEFGGKVIQ